jgi:general secretion pathway protein F
VEVRPRRRPRPPAAGLRQRLLPTRIRTGELALLTRQLATLVQSNLPLAECLQAASEQTRRPRAKAMLLQMRSRVSEGHTLAYALAEFPQVFNEMYRAMVAAGSTRAFSARCWNAWPTTRSSASTARRSCAWR